MKKLVIDEKGAALILALILLLIGGLISTALLGHMGAGILAGEVHERRTAELYAADAGVEDAIWKIQHGETLVCPGDPYWSYNITDVNGKRLQISIEYLDGGTYRITSTAITDDGSGTVATVSGTQIEAYIIGASAGGNYSGIMDNVLTSQNGIELSPNVEVNPEEGEHGPVDDYGGIWPPPEALAQFYFYDVEDETHYDGDTEIDLEGNNCPPGPIYINDDAVECPSGLGPLYIEDIENIEDGELEIVNSSNTPATLTLTGTIYITGDTLIGKTGKDFTLDLNGQTIFVASNTSGSHNALEIGDRCTIDGPGIIIAIGDIYFGPKGDVGSNEAPVFVFSVTGETQTQPQGDFYGAIAGSVVVDIQPGTSMNYPEDEGWYEGLNFPIGISKELVYSIYSWEVSQQ